MSNKNTIGSPFREQKQKQKKTYFTLLTRVRESMRSTERYIPSYKWCSGVIGYYIRLFFRSDGLILTANTALSWILIKTRE